MKSISPAFLTATLTGLVTLGMIALLFVLPINSGNTIGPDVGLKTQVKKASLFATPDVLALMNLDRMGAILTRLDNKAEHPREGFWRFTISGASVIAVADKQHDRLRILVGIQSAKDLNQTQLKKITQSNFDTALDARYAISQDVLWAIYVHPLKSLSDRQFISAIGQTVNLAVSYGGSYSSGGILFDGGDAKDVKRNEMIEKLITQGLKT